MTGEVTLRGRVLPVGRYQDEGAGRPPRGPDHGDPPQRNEKDLEDIPQEVRDRLSIVTVDRIDEAMNTAFGLERSERICVHAESCE